MLHLLTGPDREAGIRQLIKTVCARAKEGIGAQIIIVPEQYSFEAERMLCALGGDEISRFAEVLSFTRLSSRVFSIYGGVSEEFLDEGGRLLSLYLAAERVKTQIKYYAPTLLRPEFLAQLGKVVEELMSWCVSPQQLMQAAGSMQGQQAQKFTELALLYESYLSVCKTGRADPVTRQVRLAETLEKEAYCEGKRFYVAGFSDFTGVQARILEAILPQAEEVEVFLCTNRAGQGAFSAAAQTARQLQFLAQRRNVEVQRTTVEEDGTKPRALRFWLEHLFDADGEVSGQAAEEVTLVQEASCAMACQTAAAIIQKLQKSGARWREIAVACTDGSYEKTLRPMLARAGIGAYYAGTVDILQKPLIQAVISAMQAASRFSYEDVMQYLKSGCAPLTPEACDQIERYAYFWNIQGSMWLHEWTRHPDGYGQEMKEDTKKTLFTLNVWREGAMQPLWELSKAWSKERTVRARVRALCDFLEQTHFPETACEQTNALYAQGLLQQAQEQEQLYEILMAAIEQAELVLGEQEMELERFLQLFRMLLGCYQVGSIPATLDQVMVGSLDAMRHARAAHLLVLGADEGLLPAFTQAEGLLLDSERQKLLELGVTLSPCMEGRLEREMGWTHLALQGAEKEVFLIAGSEQVSYLFTRTEKLLPACRRIPGRTLTFLPDRAALAAQMAREERSDVVDPALLQLRLEFEKKRAYAFTPLSRAGVQGLYGKTLALSASKLDSFAGCRLAFFLRYGLKLTPWRQVSFDAPAFGTFAHYVLECTVRDVMARGGFEKTAEEDVLSIARGHMDAYTKKFMLQAEDAQERTGYLFARNREEVLGIVQNVAEELAKSRFSPCDVELAFSKDGALPPVYIHTPDGQAVLSGFVDRVDVYEEQGEGYFRVIDYKTGHKDFDYTDLLCGQGLQMLIYLFAISRAKGGHAAAGKRPAGVLYVPGRVDLERLEPGQGEEKLSQLRAKHLQRQGLVLDNEQILQAMEPGETPQYLPYQNKKDGRVGDLATAEQFGKLEGFVGSTLTKMTQEIFSGSVAPNPIVRGPMVSSCTYCEFQSVCHKDLNGQRPRYLKKIGAEEFWDEVERRGHLG